MHRVEGIQLIWGLSLNVIDTSRILDHKVNKTNEKAVCPQGSVSSWSTLACRKVIAYHGSQMVCGFRLVGFQLDVKHASRPCASTPMRMHVPCQPQLWVKVKVLFTHLLYAIDIDTGAHTLKKRGGASRMNVGTRRRGDLLHIMRKFMIIGRSLGTPNAEVRREIIYVKKRTYT